LRIAWGRRVIAAVLAAAAEPSPGPQWYEVAAGIIAVPAAVIGLVAAILGLAKIRLETKKLGLETLKLQNELKGREVEIAAAPPETRAAVRGLLDPLHETRRNETLVLRFAIIYVALIIWNTASDVLDFVTRLAAVGIGGVTGSFDDSNWLLYVPIGITALVKGLGYFGIVVLLGVPLLRDLTDALNYNLPWRRRNQPASRATADS
jgi:hypothetical protein